MQSCGECCSHGRSAVDVRVKLYLSDDILNFGCLERVISCQHIIEHVFIISLTTHFFFLLCVFLFEKTDLAFCGSIKCELSAYT